MSINPAGATAAANSATNAIANSSSTGSTTTASGFSNLTTGDFMKMLIAELQNQDPTQPMSNQDLLTQLSTMSQLQSTQDLDKALQTNTNNQQLSIASSFIGRAVQGKDSNNNLVSGIAQEAVLQNGTAEVAVGNSLLPVANITAVAPAQSGG
ncbi:MAG TPA: flagellar hook capping FlgD N-terminal domain-containing protein [Planctomycetaceae bacterium]|jgi:flagellar basal-body rod modification protein FlgD|nr:flagellar hook capping FlgD N-terminal domain-containing protein [Planctomycetaceae bacterium]